METRSPTTRATKPQSETTTPGTTVTPPPSAQSNPFSQESLLAEREGFGANVTGGQGGDVLTVTSLHDNKEEIEPGTLRWALEQDKPAIVRFAINGVIKLKDDINVRSNKTLDGRGADITLTENGLNIEDVENVIITNIKITDGRQYGSKECNLPSTGDAIQIRNSKKVWIHHVSLSSFCDGLTDIVNGSSEVTVSWSRYENHSKTMLIGNSVDRGEIDKNITATISHNVFNNLVQRIPRVRFGKVDVYNNYYSNWSSYAVGSSIDSQVIVENNVFEPGSQTADDEKDIAQDRVGEDPRGGFARTINNLLLNGARERSISPDKVFTRPYTSNIETASESLKQSLLAEAGFRSPGFFEQKFGATIHNYDTDLNHDGATNTTDLTFCISEYGTSGQNLICDLDKDGFVNAVDYSGVIEGFNQN
jgi:pectate lyase